MNVNLLYTILALKYCTFKNNFHCALSTEIIFFIPIMTYDRAIFLIPNTKYQYEILKER